MVGRCAGDDYGGTAGGIIFYSVLNAIGKGVFGKLVEQRVDFLHAVAVAALGGYLRQRADKKLVFLAPADDAGEFLWIVHGEILVLCCLLGRGIAPPTRLVDCFEYLLFEVFGGIVAVVATQCYNTFYSLFREAAVTAFSSSFELFVPMRSQHCL